MTPHAKFGIAGVIIGSILFGFISPWLALLVIVLAITVPATAWLMLDPSQRRRYRELRHRQRQIRSGSAGEQRQEAPTKPVSQSTDLGVTSSPLSEAKGLDQKDRLIDVRKEKLGRVLGSVQASEQPRETALGSEAPVGSSDLTVDGPVSGEGSAGAVRITIYLLQEESWLPDNESAGTGTDGRGMESPGEHINLLIMSETVLLSSQADIAKIESFRIEYQDSEVSKDRRDEIKVAAAKYAASSVEGKCDPAWWEASVSLPLPEAADLLDGSAEWLRGLFGHPLVDAASRVGIQGPTVDIGAGIMVNFATARMTEPLEDAARICEVAGIALGLATGAHPLVIACGKRLAYGELGDVIAEGFEKVFDSVGAAFKQTAEDPSPAVGHHDDPFSIDFLVEDFRNSQSEAGHIRAELGLKDVADDPDPDIDPGGPDIWRDSFGM